MSTAFCGLETLWLWTQPMYHQEMLYGGTSLNKNALFFITDENQQTQDQRATKKWLDISWLLLTLVRPDSEKSCIYLARPSRTGVIKTMIYQRIERWEYKLYLKLFLTVMWRLCVSPFWTRDRKVYIRTVNCLVWGVGKHRDCLLSDGVYLCLACLFVRWLWDSVRNKVKIRQPNP